MIWTGLLLAAQALHVGSSGPYGSIAAALADAEPGDTIWVAEGVYREHLTIDVPVVLIGVDRPIIDGEGRGTVVAIGAPVVMTGFEVRNSGKLLDEEDAGILVRADSCVIRGNVLTDVLFGIYLKESDANHVSGNLIIGKDRPLGVRGDGIRLWYSHDDVVEANRVERTRDVVIYFSEGLLFRDNVVTDGRYGLHYMYSSHNVFERNEFARNDVAAFIMYSSDIVLRDNVFAQASGRSGYGLGLKDADRIEVTGNLIVQNRVGIYLDNSPSEIDGANRITGNVLAFNDVAVELMPSVRLNEFAANSFVANLREVSVSGGGTALANEWHGNHWDRAVLWDEDEDGSADLPFKIDRLSDDLYARYPELQLFELSPATSALDALVRFFPLLEPKPIVVDSGPQPPFQSLASMGQAAFGARRNGLSAVPAEPPPSRAAGATAWLLLLGISLWGVWRWPR